MGYSSQAISGFNSSPPSNDGSQTTANQLDWDTHINKIGTPLKDLAEGINSAVVSFAATRFGNSVTEFTTTTTFDGNDEGSVQVFTGSSNTTATLPSAATVGNDWTFCVSNEGSATLTVDGAGSETISGSLTKTLEASQSIILVSDGTNWRVIGVSPDQVNSTGFVMPYIGTSAPTGWVALDRSSIGETGSSADDSSDDNLNLFVHLHGQYSDTEAPVLEASAGWQTIESVQTGADTITITGHGLLSNTKVVLLDGGSGVAPTGLLFNVVYYVVTDTSDTFKLSATTGPGAAINLTGSGSGTLKIAEVSKATATTDFTSGKIMVMPDWQGRAVIGTGTGEDGTGVSTLSARAIGERDGGETHTLTTSEIPGHTHLMFTSDNVTSPVISGSVVVSKKGGVAGDYRYDMLEGTSSIDSGVTDTGTGGGGSHTIMQPWVAALWCVKK